MINPDLLEILCCPETHQGLEMAEPALTEKLNERITAGDLRSRAGEVVQEKIDGGLVRADRKYLYPIRRDTPILLTGEAIPLPG